MSFNRAAEQELTNYLNHVALVRERGTGTPPGFAYSSVEQWVLEHGKFYKPPVEGGRMTQRYCFANAYVWAQRHGCRYVEGYAIGMIPVLHAWCADASDNVIETTWEEPGHAYFGVSFPLEEVRRRRRGYKELSVLDDWERDYPLLKVRNDLAQNE